MEQSSIFSRSALGITSKEVSDETKDLFLDPKTDIDEITKVKRPEGVGVLDIFSSDPAKRRAAFFGESKASKMDLIKLLAEDKQFQEEFVAVEGERALRERDERENSIQNQTFDFFHKKLGISPSIARDLTFAADFAPVYGESVSVEDAANAFKRGDIGEAAFHSTLVGIGLIPVAGDMLVHALKGNRSAIPKMFGGRGKPEELKSDSIFVYDTSNEAVQPMVGAKGHVAPNSKLVESRKIFNDFLQNEPELSKKVDVDENGELAYTGNIIADIKTMPKPLAKKTVEKLDEMWRKTGWTAGANNRFFTEISDKNAVFDAKKFIELEKESFKKNQQLLSGIGGDSDFIPTNGVKLSEVLDHPELYKAYPELKHLPIKMFNRSSTKKDVTDLASYFPNSDAMIELNPRIFRSSTNETGFFTKDYSPEDWIKVPSYTNPSTKLMTEIKRIVLHEVQHAIQHIEGFPFSDHSVAKKALDRMKKKYDKDIKLFEKSIKNNEDKINKISLENMSREDIQLYRMLDETNKDLHSKVLLYKFESDKLKEISRDDIYRHSWEEVESQNVENRIWMTLSQRMKKSPYQTIGSKNKFNRRDIIQRIATNDATGEIDYKKYQDLMDEYEDNMIDFISVKSQQQGIKFTDIEVKDQVDNFFFSSISPGEAGNLIPELELGDIEVKFANLYKNYMIKERQQFNKLLPTFSKERIYNFIVGSDDIFKQAESDIITLHNSFARSDGRIGLSDITYYDTADYDMQMSPPFAIKEVTPSSLDLQEPFPIFSRQPENFDIGKSKYNKILRNPKANRFPATETFLQISNPKGDIAGGYYNYDYGKFYGDKSKERVQDLYERGELKDFIDLYKETGGQNMPDEMIVDEFFDDVDFKVTAYPVNKNNESVTVKFHPSELIEFPGAAAEHRTRSLDYERSTPTASSKRTIKRAEEMADKAVKSYDKKDIRNFISEFLDDEFKNLAPEAGKKVEDFTNQFSFTELFDVPENYAKFSKLQDEHIDAIYDEAIQKVIRNPDGSLNNVEVEEMPKKALALLVQEVRNKNRGTTNFKLKNLKDRIAKEGYDPDPIHVVVRQDGKPFIHEGNHRLQEAFDSDRDFIEAKLTYIRGGEEANGPLNPERIGLIEKGFLND
tara:strand:- start:2765 stop:6151 length:3387 start_codon:yes stop_codon:yes gene_type:complete